MRRWFVITASVLLVLFVVGALAGDPEEPADRAAKTGETADPADPTPSASPTPDPADEARAEAARLFADGRYPAAVAVLEDAGLTDEAELTARRGAGALYKQARKALVVKRYSRARTIAVQARRLHRTVAIVTVIDLADTAIAEARAAARERRRLARIARDQRTCTTSEKATVRVGGGVPAGCADFAAVLEARRAAREAEEAAAAASQCDPNYEGACLDPNSSDYDCAGGSGDGPDYTGTVRVVGDDIHDLDRDGDGIACDA